MNTAQSSSPVDGDPDTLKNLFGMKRLALAEAFSMEVGLDAYDDPQEVNRLLGELVSVRKEQQKLIASISMLHEQAAAGKPPEPQKNIDNESSWSVLLSMEIVFDEPKPTVPGHKGLDAEEKRLDAKEGNLLYELAKSSGVIRRLSDQKIVEKCALACGRQLSQEQLSFGDTLDNLDKNYSIKASVDADGQISFSVQGTSAAIAPSTLGRLVSGELGAEGTPLFFVSTDDALDFFRASDLTGLLAKSLGLKKNRHEQTPRRLVNPSTTSRFYKKTKWAHMSPSTISTLTLEISQLVAQAEKGDFMSDLLTSATYEKSSGFDFVKGSSSHTKLQKALSAPLLAISERIKTIAEQDRQARTVAWFDEIAGQGSSALVGRVWGQQAAMTTSFSEIEMVCCNALNIWKSLEGQEALGLFSVRLANSLGLSLSGRDLPERTKAKLKSSYGLTDGAWRLLGKLSPEKASAASKWTFYIGQSAHARSQNNAAQKGAGEQGKIRKFVNNAGFDRRLANVRGGAATPQWQQLEQMEEKIKKLFATAISTCSAKGADPQKTELLLEALFEEKTVFASLFFTPPQHGIDILQGQDAADIAAENDAFHAKAPILLTRILEKFLAKPDEREWPLVAEIRDWMNNAEWGVWRDLPSKGLWEEVNRRQKFWHEMVQRRERSEHETVSWPSLAGPDADRQSGFSSMPLTDGGMLWDEGKAMRHCVSSYADKCLKGGTRIFSILKDGRRFGTLELSLKDEQDKWQIAQFKGKCNHAIEDERADEFASKICEKYQLAHLASKLAEFPNEANVPETLRAKLSALREPKRARDEGVRPADM